MQSNLCSNIDFIFGPPRTGKTTYLGSEIIIPRMKQEEDVKILVLTPTNKAADVIIRKIQEVTFDIRQLSRSVTVTTIDRFPYDVVSF